MAVLWLACVPARAEMYKWTDEKGVSHYTNKPPPKPSSKVKVVEGRVSSFHVKPSGAGGDLKNLQGPPAAASVELFTTTWCGYCRQAKSYLASHGVSYQEFDVEADPAAAARAKSLGWSGGVPFAFIGGTPVRGFSAAAYDRALASSKK